MVERNDLPKNGMFITVFINNGSSLTGTVSEARMIITDQNKWVCRVGGIVVDHEPALYYPQDAAYWSEASKNAEVGFKLRAWEGRKP